MACEDSASLRSAYRTCGTHVGQSFKDKKWVKDASPQSSRRVVVPLASLHIVVRKEPEATKKCSSVIREFKDSRRCSQSDAKHSQGRHEINLYLSLKHFIFHIWRGLEMHILSSSVSPCYVIPICQMHDRVLYYISMNDAT